MTVVFIALAIVVLIYLGKMKLPGNFVLDGRYNPNRARFYTPGRNARQQQITKEKNGRQVRREEVVVLENCEGGGGVEEHGGEGVGGEGGVEEGEGEFMEHAELARGVRDVST